MLQMRISTNQVSSMMLRPKKLEIRNKKERSDGLIIYGFTSRSRIFHLYGDVTSVGEGQQNLGLCSALRALEQGGICMTLCLGYPLFFEARRKKWGS
jgi:hypothetical protein